MYIKRKFGHLLNINSDLLGKLVGNNISLIALFSPFSTPFSSFFITSMSTQSGISASEELLQAFKNFDVNVLVVKVAPDNTSLEPDPQFTQPTSSDHASVFSSLHSYFARNHPYPGYIIIPETSSDYGFISFIPDVAPIREKMLYASTKNTLLQQLGSNNFKKSHTLAWTDLDELSHEHYKKVTGESDPLALTEEEKMLKEINSLQALSLAEAGGKKELASMHTQGQSSTLFFNVDPELELEFKSIPQAGNSKKLLTFNIDIPNEIVKLTSKVEDVGLSSLISQFEDAGGNSTPHPQFALYNYSNNKFAFIYSCPSGSKVKDRMIYASNRQSLVNFVKSFTADTDVKLEKVLEVGDIEELNIAELKDEVESESPAPSKGGLKFSKPKGPRRR